MHSRVGGRYVQTTYSSAVERGWAPWELIRIQSLPAETVDLYFFVVQQNPVDKNTLLALFPVSQPPHACIGLAFSRDGVNFSSPVHLRHARGGWRTHNSNGTGAIEWRSEDHPASGVIQRGGEVWFYVHVAVKGTSMRESAGEESVLVRHRMRVERLLELTTSAFS